MLCKEELMRVYAGAVDWAVVGVVAATIVFIIGVVDGFVRPLDCED